MRTPNCGSMACIAAARKSGEDKARAAVEAFWELDGLIDEATRWLNDATKWGNDERLGPRFQSLRDRVQALSSSGSSGSPKE